MKKYRVYASIMTTYYRDVEAESYREAEDLACNQNIGMGEWKEEGVYINLDDAELLEEEEEEEEE